MPTHVIRVLGSHGAVNAAEQGCHPPPSLVVFLPTDHHLYCCCARPPILPHEMPLSRSILPDIHSFDGAPRASPHHCVTSHRRVSVAAPKLLLGVREEAYLRTQTQPANSGGLNTAHLHCGAHTHLSAPLLYQLCYHFVALLPFHRWAKPSNALIACGLKGRMLHDTFSVWKKSYLPSSTLLKI
jgi:hypothetical protein